MLDASTHRSSAKKYITGKYSKALVLTAQVQCCHAYFCIFTGTEGNLKQLLECTWQPKRRVALRLVWAAWLTAHCCSRENPIACLAFSKWQLR